MGEEFNPKAFINVFDFESIDSCISYVKKIDCDNDLYLAMQREPIFKSESFAKRYYDNPDMLVDYLSMIFDKPIGEARKIFNTKGGYNKFYINVIKRDGGQEHCVRKCGVV